MPNSAYYREWLINCSMMRLEGEDPGRMARGSGGGAELLHQYKNLPETDRVPFCEAMESIVRGENGAPIEARIDMVQFAALKHIDHPGLKDAVMELDRQLPERPVAWSDDQPRPANWQAILLRGMVNMYITFITPDPV